jgi:coproporphyrinogen III oxidase-like Fe-S oxidoreductase
MMGMRTVEGLDLHRHATLAGRPLNPDTIDHLTGLGLLRTGDGRLVATLRGRILLDAILGDLATG